MRVLILGANGQLGRAVQDACPPHYDLLAWGHSEADITKPEVAANICRVQPDVVINCAAWTNVDGAEREPHAAFAVNALGAHYIATACAMSGATMVHVSTNEVFAGMPGRFYFEYEGPTPASVYARSKAAGENAAARLLKNLYIVRVAWLFGPGGSNFPAKIVAAADRNGSLKVVDDEYGNPTYAPDAAEAIFQLIQTEYFGIYHLVNQGYANRFDFACAVLDASGRSNIPVTPIKLVEWPRPAPPPPHAVLVNQAAASMGIVLRPWQEAVAEYAGANLESVKYE